MKKILVLICFICLFPVDSNAFTFDVWESGVFIKKARRIAHRNNIEFVNDASGQDDDRVRFEDPRLRFDPDHNRLDSSGESYEANQGRLEFDHDQKCKKLEYLTRLFDQEALVTLKFTKMSNLLFEIDINWTNVSRKDSIFLRKKLIGILTKKYGSFEHERVVFQQPVKLPFGHKRKRKRCEGWVHDFVNNLQDDTLYLHHSKCVNELSLQYTNRSLKKLNRKESRKRKRDKNHDGHKL